MFNWIKSFFASTTGVKCAYDDLPAEIRSRLYDRNNIVSIEKQVSIIITKK